MQTLHAPASINLRASGAAASSDDTHTAREMPRALQICGVLTPLPDPGAPLSQTTSRGAAKSCIWHMCARVGQQLGSQWAARSSRSFDCSWRARTMPLRSRKRRQQESKTSCDSIRTPTLAGDGAASDAVLATTTSSAGCCVRC